MNGPDVSQFSIYSVVIKDFIETKFLPRVLGIILGDTGCTDQAEYLTILYDGDANRFGVRGIEPECSYVQGHVSSNWCWMDLRFSNTYIKGMFGGTGSTEIKQIDHKMKIHTTRASGDSTLTAPVADVSLMISNVELR